MKYRVTVCYGGPALDSITSWMRQIFPDWEKERKRLLWSWSIEFETDIPITPGDRIDLEGQLSPEVDHIELEEIG